MPAPIPQIPLSKAQMASQAARLATVRPELVRAYEVALGRWLGDRELMLLGRPIVTFGHRSNASQAAIYAQGRQSFAEVNRLRKLAGDAPFPNTRAGRAEAGRIVSYTPAGKSKHNALPSDALDVAHLLADGTVVWEPARLLLFSRLMRAADKTVVWGADWDSDGLTSDESFKDWPHFQYGR